ncbi:unnamed protein product [Hymenolepis diminuta]|uniref:VPS10 domain-containing protein n=1 Tax=Hymenolepis diminuta TaxID=6216 RepID=A0A564ZB45_HYMDI|nr:unnamed protein product [Hymenolepis diminuta]
MRCSIMFLLTILAVTASVYASDPDKCKAQQKLFTEAIKHGHPIDFYYFKNDTKETIQLTWTGDSTGIIILVTMSESEQGLGQPSDLYRSTDNGKTFEKITGNLDENIHIKRENGLQTWKTAKNRKIYVVCYDMQNRNHTLIYSTTDSGQSWNKSKLPFILNGKLKLLVVDADSYSVLAMEANTKTLFVSIGDDSSWKSALQDVQDFFWSRFTFDPKDTIYALHGKSPKKPTSNRDAYTLSKSEDGGSTWRVLLRNVRKIWAPETYTDADDDDPKSGPAGRFLYAAHFTEDADNEKGPLKLSVSEDGGNTFHPVFLPAVTSDRFFSVLEIERDCVFLHVDEPGDTGHGILYVSDSTGTVFTESLRRHFYPNQATVTDFFRVLSIPGTFLATQMNPDTTLRTVITHNRGATWQPLPVPQGLSCDPPRSKMIQGEQSRIVPPDYSNSAERLKAVLSSGQNNSSEAFEPVCGLQVSNQFSLRKRVVASPPLAISSARGLILVHGHVATHLKTTPADVFISDDGGYTWYKVSISPHLALSALSHI